jgi:DNA-binding response OmpR family regulator
MGAVAQGGIFLFEGFQLDQRGLFRRDERGVLVPVAVGGRAIDLLGVLVERHGEVLSKAEIMAAVWPKTVVEEGNLTLQISALRRVLDRGRSGAAASRRWRGAATLRMRSPPSRARVLRVDRHGSGSRRVCATSVNPSN